MAYSPGASDPVVILIDDVPYRAKVTGKTPSARSVFVDAPIGEACPAMITNSRLFFLGFSFRRTYSVLGSTVDGARADRTMKSRV